MELKLSQEFLTENDCYQAGRKIVPKGIMVHSTGVAQPDPQVFIRRWNKPGVEVCVHAFVAREVRVKRCGTPILMLTARSELEDRIEGLNAGADYYLTKPFDIRELLACINALLRRQGPQVDQVTLGNTALDLGACTLICGEKRVQLSAREFDVMRILLRSQSTILSKEVILARVWGYDSDAVENHVEVYVGFLRKKLHSIGSNIRIEAVRRLGYRLEVDEEC